MKTNSLVLFVSVLIAATLFAARADSGETDLQSLQRTIQALQQRVEILEAIKPTFTDFMPNIAERFHVLHRAGEKGDWAVAGHELQELKRLTSLSRYVDAEYGALMQGIMESSFDALENAIKHGNQEKLQAALTQTVNACNACHTATGSQFIQVVLDAKESISMRHPHALAQSEMVGGHTHSESAMMQKSMMKNMTGSESEESEHHDDKAEHGDDKHQD